MRDLVHKQTRGQDYSHRFTSSRATAEFAIFDDPRARTEDITAQLKDRNLNVLVQEQRGTSCVQKENRMAKLVPNDKLHRRR